MAADGLLLPNTVGAWCLLIAEIDDSASQVGLAGEPAQCLVGPDCRARRLGTWGSNRHSVGAKRRGSAGVSVLSDAFGSPHLVRGPKPAHGIPVRLAAPHTL